MEPWSADDPWQERRDPSPGWDEWPPPAPSADDYAVEQSAPPASDPWAESWADDVPGIPTSPPPEFESESQPAPDAGYEPSEAPAFEPPEASPVPGFEPSFDANASEAESPEADPRMPSRSHSPTSSPPWRPESSHGRPTPIPGAPPGRCRRSSRRRLTEEPVAAERGRRGAGRRRTGCRGADRRGTRRRGADRRGADCRGGRRRGRSPSEPGRRGARSRSSRTPSHAGSDEQVARSRSPMSPASPAKAASRSPSLAPTSPWRQARPTSGARPSPTSSRSR